LNAHFIASVVVAKAGEERFGEEDPASIGVFDGKSLLGAMQQRSPVEPFPLVDDPVLTTTRKVGEGELEEMAGGFGF
jgi:hypothetical protein